MIKSLTLSELERILFRKKTIILFIIFLIIIIANSAFLSFFDIGFYNRETPVQLNNLNLPLLVAKEIYIILGLLIFPLLFIDSFSGEMNSGAYRLVMIRPSTRIEFLISKLLTQLFIIFVFLISSLIVSYIFGTLIFDSSKQVTILDKENLTQIEVLIYTFKFYGVLFIISSSIMVIAQMVCLIFPNTILNFLIILGILIGSIYINDNFSFFLLAGEYTFKLLNEGNITFFVINGIILILGSLINLITWNKKDIFD